MLTELTELLLYRSVSAPFHYHTGFIEPLSFPVSRFLISPPNRSLSVPVYLSCVRHSPSLSFPLALSSIHPLCQLLANPSSNPVKERYAVSSYLG